MQNCELDLINFLLNLQTKLAYFVIMVIILAKK